MDAKIAGCEVVDYDKKMIMDGYVLVHEITPDENQIMLIRHVKVVSVPPDFRERKEKDIWQTKVIEHQYEEPYYKLNFANLEEVVKLAKEKLARICRKPKDLLIDKSAVEWFEWFEKEYVNS